MTKSKITKLVSGFAGFAVALGFAVTPVIASAQSATDLQSQINSLLATIQSLQSQLAVTTGGSTVMTSYTFNANLTVGSTGTDVMHLQKVLNSSADTRVSVSGAGSPGNESSYFGLATKAAVMKFQAKYGISPVSGYVGPLSRAKLNTMSGTVVPPVTCTSNCTVPPPVVGGALVFAAASQPANSLAPQGASRVPFTTFTLTNTGSNTVTVTGVTVQRNGLAQDLAFSGIVLVDSNNVQIGTSKTFNSNHQAVVGDTFTINPGETKTLTVAGNIATGQTTSGQVASIAVVGVNTSATVSGSFPITGAQQTINSTLSVGSVTAAISSFDPNSAQTKNIGDTAVKFSGIRFTAGSVEDLKLYSIRWRQNGSVGSSDLANVVTVVDGTSYPTTLSADGKYFTSVFPGGLLIAKGVAKDVYVQGDIIGTNSASRNIEFDIDRTSDVYFVGQLYGYGVMPAIGGSAVSSASTHGSAITTSQPYFQGSTVAITGASVTTAAKASEVPAQNIAINVPNQPLGGYILDLKGEGLQVQSQVFYFNYSSSAATGNLLTNVSLVDQNGAVIAGPVDAVVVGGTSQKVTFTDTVTYQPGRHVYTLKGKIPASITNGQTITASTTPSTDWTNVTGATSGNTISLSSLSSTITMNQMTVKPASLAVTISSTPSAQTIVSGGVGTVFANIQLDAQTSGEDVRFSSIPVQFNTTATLSGTGILSACQLFDNGVALNTGSNVLNPVLSTSVAVANGTFTLDNSVVVSKGTTKTLTVKCNVASGATGALSVGMTGTQIGAIAATGVTSSNTVTATGSTAVGQVQTLASAGTIAVSNSASAPALTIVASSVATPATNVTSAAYKLRATNEDVNLSEIGLVLTSGSAASVSSVNLYKGLTNGTLIGTVVFNGSATVASTTVSGVTISNNVDTDIVAVVNYNSIGSNQPAVAGATVKIDISSIKGTGAASGNTLYSSGSTSVAGVIVQKSYPIVALDSNPTNGVVDGNLAKFKVTANAAGSIGVNQFVFTLASSTNVTVSNLALYGYTDSSYSTPIAGFSGGVLASGISITNIAGVNYATSTVSGTQGVQIGAGNTNYFLLKGTVSYSGSNSTYSITSTLLGDSASQALAAVASVPGRFVWSPNSTTTSVTTVADWTNGYVLPGLPSVGLSVTRSN